jgi:hypothetical protein
MARQKQPWEIKEEELLALENAYLQKYNWFELLMDDHLYYVLVMTFTTPLWFLIGLAIGALIAR